MSQETADTFAVQGKTRQKRRSSILKPQQPTQNYHADAETTTTKTMGTRRVSFSNMRLVKQFDTVKNVSMSPKNEPVSHHDSSAEASKHSDQSKSMTMTQVNMGHTSVYESHTAFNSVAMEETRCLRSSVSFYMEEDNCDDSNSGRVPLTSTPCHRMRGVSAFGLEAEAEEDDDMQLSDEEQSVNVRRLVARHSLAMDMTLGNASSSQTRKFLGNLIAEPQQQWTTPSNLTTDGNASSSHTRNFLGNLVAQPQPQWTTPSNLTTDGNVSSSHTRNFLGNLIAEPQQQWTTPSNLTTDGLSDMQLEEEEEVMSPAARQQEESVAVELELSEVETSATRHALAAIVGDSMRHVYENNSLLREGNNSAPFSSSQHQRSNTMMELSMDAEETENQTRKVLASIGGVVEQSLREDQDSTVSAEMTFTAPQIPPVVVGESHSAIGQNAASIYMDLSAQSSAARSANQENLLVSAIENSLLNASKQQPALNETFTNKCVPPESPLVIAKKKTRQFSPLNKSQRMPKSFTSHHSMTDKGLSVVGELSSPRARPNNSRSQINSTYMQISSGDQPSVGAQQLSVNTTTNSEQNDEQQSSTPSTGVISPTTDSLTSLNEQSAAADVESELERTVAQMRRSVRRSIDDSIRASAMSPRRRRSRTLLQQSHNWSALNASNVTNLLDDVSMQLKESTLDETNTEHKRVFASVAVRSLLDPSFTVDLAEPKCTTTAFADIEETIIEETVSVPLVSLDVNPELKQMGMCQPNPADCDVVVSSKQKLIESARLTVQNANEKLRMEVDSRLIELSKTDPKLAEAIRKLNPAKLNGESRNLFDVCRYLAQSDWCLYRSKMAESLKNSLQTKLDSQLSEYAKNAEARSLIDQLAVLKQDESVVNARLALQQKVEISRVDEIVNRKHDEERMKAEMDRLQIECEELDMKKTKARIALLEAQNAALDGELLAARRRRQQRHEQTQLNRQRFQQLFQQIEIQ